MTDPINDLLNDREKTHGVYSEQALTAQALKHVMSESPNWRQMPAYMRESLELISTKISRICNGDMTVVDSWQDIIGYSQLVIRELEK